MQLKFVLSDLQYETYEIKPRTKISAITVK